MPLIRLHTYLGAFCKYVWIQKNVWWAVTRGNVVHWNVLHEQTIVSVGYLVLMPLIRLQRLYLSPQRLTALASIHNLPFFLLGFHVCPILFVLLNLRLLPLYSLSVLSQLLLWFFQSFHIYLPFTVSTFIHDPFVSVLSYWHLNVT